MYPALPLQTRSPPVGLADGVPPPLPRRPWSPRRRSAWVREPRPPSPKATRRFDRWEARWLRLRPLCYRGTRSCHQRGVCRQLCAIAWGYRVPVRWSLIPPAGLVLVACGFGGCGGPDREMQRVAAEKTIRTELLGTLEDDGHGPFAITKLSCLHEEEGRFKCLSSVGRSYEEGPGSSVSEAQLIRIVASCGDNTCTWSRTG